MLAPRIRGALLHTSRLRVVRSIASLPQFAHFEEWPSAGPALKEEIRKFLAHPDADPRGLEARPTLKLQRDPDWVQKLGLLAQWEFHLAAHPMDHCAPEALADEGKKVGSDHEETKETKPVSETSAAEQLGKILMKQANMAASPVWLSFFMRQFFLSKAPLQSFLRVFEQHEEAWKAMDATHVAEALPSERIVNEYVLRGRVDEAITAFESLELTSMQKRRVFSLLYHREQFDAVIRVFQIQQALDAQDHRKESTLNPFYLLQAYHRTRRHANLPEVFHSLPEKDQKRSDLQRLAVVTTHPLETHKKKTKQTTVNQEKAAETTDPSPIEPAKQ